MHTAQHKNMQKCIEICNECKDECQNVLVNHCLPMGGEHAETEHVKLMLDCIQACQTAADFMTRIQCSMPLSAAPALMYAKPVLNLVRKLAEKKWKNALRFVGNVPKHAEK